MKLRVLVSVCTLIFLTVTLAWHVVPAARSVQEICQGDVNGDRSVNALDFALVSAAVGDTNTRDDVNLNGVVDVFDLSTILTRWDTACGGPPQPNLVVIMVDNQDYRSVPKMPYVNGVLAREATEFLNSFVVTPECCPSRASFMTGQFTHNHGVWRSLNPHGLTLVDQEHTLPIWLQAAGYDTALVGKYLHGYGNALFTDGSAPPGWTEWYGTRDPTTYRYYDYDISMNGTGWEHRGLDASDYQPDVETEKAVDFILRKSTSQRPFFLWLSYIAIHELRPGDNTTVPAPRHDGMFASEPLPQPPNFNEADVSDKPQVVDRIRKDRPFSPSEIERITEKYRKRLEALQAVDEGVRRVIEALSATGKLANTYVIFTSDNGQFQGEHRLSKLAQLLYEESIRVPLLVVGPDVLRQVRSEMVANIDLTATLVELAGARGGGHKGKPMDGRSLVPLLQGSTPDWRDDLLLESPTQGVSLYIPDAHAIGVRTPEQVYVEYSTGETEYYDLVNDPYQLTNLLADGDPLNDPDVSGLQQRLYNLVTCSGITCN